MGVSTAATSPTVRTATPSSGSVLDVTPKQVVLNAAKASHFAAFTAQVQMQAGETRAVLAEVVVNDVQVPAGQPNLFVGVTVTCTGPGANQRMAVEAGTNVWPSASNFDIPIVGTFKSKQAGTYTCVLDIKLCDPGDCDDPVGSGSVQLGVRSADPKTYSFLLVSGAMPSWATARQIPGAKDVLVPRGKNIVMSKTLSLVGSTPPVTIGSIVSLTNCIVPDYPQVCSKATQMQTQGSSKVTMSMLVKQIARSAGARCATATAKPVTEQVTWREHHAVLQISVPSFTLSTSAQCRPSVTVTTTITVLSGNAAAVEGGGKNSWQSAIYAVPPGLL